MFHPFKAESAYCVYRGAVVGDDLPGSTVIGNINLIGHHAVVGIKCQDLKYKVGCKTKTFLFAMKHS